MGVMLQAFYWDCPKAENREHKWRRKRELSTTASLRSFPITERLKTLAPFRPSPAVRNSDWRPRGYSTGEHIRSMARFLRLRKREMTRKSGDKVGTPTGS